MHVRWYERCRTVYDVFNFPMLDIDSLSKLSKNGNGTTTPACNFADEIDLNILLFEYVCAIHCECTELELLLLLLLGIWFTYNISLCILYAQQDMMFFLGIFPLLTKQIH